MSSKRNKTNYTGVYSREHESRRYRGKPDICYDICFRLPGERKLIWEKVGWLSEKVTASMASHVRAERLKHARKVDSLPADNARLTLDEVFERFRTDYLEVMRKRPMDAVGIYEKRIKPKLGHLPLIGITAVEVDALRKGAYSGIIFWLAMASTTLAVAESRCFVKSADISTLVSYTA